MFDQELQYFIRHQDELVARYRGSVLILRGDQVVGAYPTPLEAYLAGLRDYAIGTFMIQPCEPGPAAYTVTLAPAPESRPS